MLTDELRSRRLEMLDRHFRSEVVHDWNACLATFKGVPRYEIVALGQIHEGTEAVLKLPHRPAHGLGALIQAAQKISPR